MTNEEIINRLTVIKEINEYDPVMIDNVDVIALNKAIESVKNERPQCEWFDCLTKGLLKARHGDYVVYKVDYLLDHLAREVFNMEGARRMKPVKEADNEQ